MIPYLAIILYAAMGIMNVMVKHSIAKKWAPVTRHNGWKSVLLWPIELFMLIVHKASF